MFLSAQALSCLLLLSPADRSDCGPSAGLEEAFVLCVELVILHSALCNSGSGGKTMQTMAKTLRTCPREQAPTCRQPGRANTVQWMLRSVRESSEGSQKPAWVDELTEPHCLYAGGPPLPASPGAGGLLGQAAAWPPGQRVS